MSAGSLLELFVEPSETEFGRDNKHVCGRHPDTGWPVVSSSGHAPHLRQDEFDAMTPVFAYHAKSFDMNVDAERADYVAVMTKSTNGQCLVNHRVATQPQGKAAPVIWLEWAELAMAVPEV